MIHVPNRFTATASVRALRRRATQGEQRLWGALRNRQLLGVKFRRQHALHGFIADFYCRELHLVVEVDGPSHDEARAPRDEARDRILAHHGITTLRLTEADVIDDLERARERVAEVIRSLSRGRGKARGCS